MKLRTITGLQREIERQYGLIKQPGTQNIRRLRREFSRGIAELPAEKVVQLALRLIQNGKVPRFFSYELVHSHPAAIKSLNSRTLSLLGRGMHNWSCVDAFACYLSGPVWRERQIQTSLIQRWARSSDRWWRRAAVVSTVALNNKARGGKGDSVRTLQICRMVIHDRDEMIIKALSWALRELSKREPSAVETFLGEDGVHLAPRVLREVRNKLNTGLKNPKSR